MAKKGGKKEKREAQKFDNLEDKRIFFVKKSMFDNFLKALF